VPDQSEPEQLYVVAEEWPADHWTTVTDPKPKAEAEQWARDNRYAFAGWLEVRPATQADLDDADGEA
jgi:hypothetical protein